MKLTRDSSHHVLRRGPDAGRDAKASTGGGKMRPQDWKSHGIGASGMLVVVIAILLAAGWSSTALGKAKGSDRPLRGTESGITTGDIATSTASAGFTGHLSHLGKYTGHSNVAITFTGPSSFTAAGTGTMVAANGDKLFVDITWAGTFTATAIHTTVVRTIVGGTGRFADASGTLTVTLSSVYSLSGTTLTSHDTGVAEGQISY
jgi:hypothetical protein